MREGGDAEQLTDVVGGWLAGRTKGVERSWLYQGLAEGLLGYDLGQGKLRMRQGRRGLLRRLDVVAVQGCVGEEGEGMGFGHGEEGRLREKEK